MMLPYGRSCVAARRTTVVGAAPVAARRTNREKGRVTVVPLEYYLILSAILFTIGVVGVIVRRNAIVLFLCIELMLNAVNLTLIAFGRFLNSMDGQVLVFIVMTVAAAEVAVGLGIIVSIFRGKPTTNVDDVSLLKG
jgi:NADH-quinone oxidoreductase subunit K